DLTKEHKLLHKKIAELTVRLDWKEYNSCKVAADIDVEMEVPGTAKAQAAPKKKKATKWQQDEMDECPAGWHA
ncbi:hypothetical protein FRC10_008308, partial [Ceratobasidium sp. 414]